MNNAQVIEKGLRTAREIIDGRILRSLKDSAFDLINMTDVPVWTHNLWDSIGCGIYKDGVLVDYSVPPKLATDPRSGLNEGGSSSRNDPYSAKPIWGDTGLDEDETYRTFWGQGELFDMLNDPPADIASMTDGFALYYVAAMPYSELLDRRYTITHEGRMFPLFISHLKSYDSN
jgi:hypothetical protein